MRYVKKPRYVYAYQMTEAAYKARPFGWPNWLKIAWDKEQSEEGALFLGGSGIMSITTCDSYQRLDIDDWLVQEGNGDIKVYEPDEFWQAHDVDKAPTRGFNKYPRSKGG